MSSLIFDAGWWQWWPARELGARTERHSERIIRKKKACPAMFSTVSVLNLSRGYEIHLNSMMIYSDFPANGGIQKKSQSSCSFHITKASTKCAVTKQNHGGGPQFFTKEACNSQAKPNILWAILEKRTSRYILRKSMCVSDPLVLEHLKDGALKLLNCVGFCRAAEVHFHPRFGAFVAGVCSLGSQNLCG